MAGPPRPLHGGHGPDPGGYRGRDPDRGKLPAGGGGGDPDRAALDPHNPPCGVLGEVDRADSGQGHGPAVEMDRSGEPEAVPAAALLLKRGKWTWGPGRLPARLAQNARMPRARSRTASWGTHLLTSGHQGTPSRPFFQPFHSRCWLIAEGNGTVLSPARRASRAARSRSNPQL